MVSCFFPLTSSSPAAAVPLINLMCKREVGQFSNVFWDVTGECCVTSKSKAAKRAICNLFCHIKSLAQLWKIKLKRKKKKKTTTIILF